MFNMFYPFLYNNIINPNKYQMTDDPPTLYAIMNAIVNFGAEESEKIKIKDLAKNCYQEIFYDLDDYGLDSSIDKEKLCCTILNHYLMQRIGFDTFNAFMIQLNVKMIEIGPIINSLLMAMNNFKLFGGRSVDRNLKDNTNTNITTTSSANTITDNRYSNTPQNMLREVQNGNYLTDYTYNQGNSTGNGTQKNIEDKDVVESIKEENGDKLDILLKVQNDLQSIYKYIYKNLDPLFYGISDY